MVGNGDGERGEREMGREEGLRIGINEDMSDGREEGREKGGRVAIGRGAIPSMIFDEASFRDWLNEWQQRCGAFSMTKQITHP